MDDDELTNQRSHAVFEFTKRKRWADILISELVNVAVFVFSTSGTVLHCDAATQPVTGYTEDQLLSKNFTDFLHGTTSLGSSLTLLILYSRRHARILQSSRGMHQHSERDDLLPAYPRQRSKGLINPTHRTQGEPVLCTRDHRMPLCLFHPQSLSLSSHQRS